MRRLAEFVMPERASAATPSAGQLVLYAKTDGFFYSRDDTGAETRMAGDSVTITAVASEALAAGDFVNLWNNGGTLSVRKASGASASLEAHGYVLAAFAGAATATVYVLGANTAASGATVGPQYLSPTVPGKTTTTIPSALGHVIQQVGVATSATRIVFDPAEPLVLQATVDPTEIQPVYIDRTTGAVTEAEETDVIGTRNAPVTPTSGSVSAIVTDSPLITPTTGFKLRLRKIHLHMDPAAGTGAYNTVTVKVGTTVVFQDKFETGLPYIEAITFVGATNAPLTITTTSTATIFYNLRTEEIA